MSYQMFIWPLADRFHQVLELLTVASQLVLLVGFTSMMGDGNHSKTLDSMVVGALITDKPCGASFLYIVDDIRTAPIR